MAQISFRVDDNVKTDAEKILDTIGLSMSAAMNIFLKTVAREKRIPFELSADPFYSANNMRYLENVMNDIKDGNAHFAEHTLIEVEWCGYYEKTEHGMNICIGKRRIKNT